MREARQTEDEESETALRDAASAMANAIQSLPKSGSMDEVRGNEGYAAAAYFSVFNKLIHSTDTAFAFDGRNRRPPRDPVNALMSFLYGLVRVECQAACEGVGLDPQIGSFTRFVPVGPPWSCWKSSAPFWRIDWRSRWSTAVNSPPNTSPRVPEGAFHSMTRVDACCWWRTRSAKRRKYRTQCYVPKHPSA